MTTAAVAQLQAAVNRLQHELTTIKISEQSPHTTGEQIYVGQYLVERLVQLGVTVRALSPVVAPDLTVCAENVWSSG